MGDPSQVASLVGSIVQYKDFKQMAGYNISCLMSHITPPHVGWRDNVEAAVNSGGIEAIVEILRLHRGSPDVLRSATEALRKMTTSPENAARVAKSGALAAALSAIGAGTADKSSQSFTIEQEDLAIEAAALLKTVAQFNPDAILDAEGGLESILAALRESNNPILVAACAEVLDRIGRTERGEAEILRLGGVEAILSSLAEGKETTEEMLKPMFRLLERLARKPDNIALIRRHGGVEALVRQLENHSESDAILRAGGRLLGIIAQGDLEEAIALLKRGNLSEKALEYTIALISNLALQPENIDRIIRQGGVKALIDNFDSYNAKTQEAAARALFRLANNEYNIQQIVAAGGVPVLVRAINNNKDNPDVLYAATQALARIATSNEANAAIVDKAGGLDAILKTLANHPEFTNVALEALKMISGLAATGFDISRFANSANVKAVVAAMQANMQNADVQLAGNRALIAIIECADKKSASTVLSAGAVPVVLRGVETHRVNGAVVDSAFQVFIKLLAQEPKAAGKALSGGLGAIVSAAFAQISQNNFRIEDSLQQLLRILVSAKQAASVISEIAKQTQALCNKRSESAASALEEALFSAAAYSKLPTLAEAMMGANAAPTLVDSLRSLVQARDVPDQFTLLPILAVTFVAFTTRNNRRRIKTFKAAGAIAGLLESVKVHAKQPEQAIACLGAVEVFAGAMEARQQVVDDGGIETCVTAVRTNSEDHAVLLAAVNVLLQMSSDDSVAEQVAYKGGTRQVIKSMVDNCSSAQFERPIERSLLLLERVAVAKGSEANGGTKATLVKQGAVDAVTKAMEAYPDSEAIEAIGARVLSRLLDKEGVTAICDKVVDLCNKVMKSRKQRHLPELSRNATTVGYLALSPGNVGIILEKGVSEALVGGIGAIRTMEQNKDRENAIRSCTRALGQIESTSPQTNGDVIPLLLQVLRDENLTSRERMGALEAIKSMASNASLAAGLVDASAVEAIMSFMKANPHNEQLATAAFGALSSISAHEIGAIRVTDVGGTKIALQWLKDNAETSSPKGAEECLSLLGNLALLDVNVPIIVEAGIIDTVISVLDAQCDDPENPLPRLLQAAVSLLGRVAVNKPTIVDIVRKGATKRVIQIANSSQVYLSDADCMEAIIFLIESCALVESVRSALTNDGAVDLIMTAMSLNSSNQDIVVTGSRALQALLGQSPETIQALLSDIKKLVNKVVKNPNDSDLQDKLEDKLRNLSNLALVDGLLNESSASETAKVLCQVITSIKGLPDGAKKQQLLAVATQALARVAIIAAGSSQMDTPLALQTVLGLVKNSKEDDRLREAALFALGNLVRDAGAVKTMDELQGCPLLEQVIKESTGDDKVHDAALSALGKVRGTTVSNIHSLADSKQGIDALASVISAHSFDLQILRQCIEEVAAAPGGLQALLSVLGTNVARNNPAMQMQILDVLQEQCESQGLKLEVTDQQQMRGLLAMLESTGNPKEDAVRQAKVLDLLKLLGVRSAGLFVKEGGATAILEHMTNHMDDPDTVEQCLTVLNNLASSNNKELVAQLVAAGAAAKIAEAMKANPGSEVINKEAIELLHKMAFTQGVDQVGLDADMMRLLGRTVDKFAANPEIQQAGGALVESLQEIFQEDGAEMIGTRLEGAMAKLLGAEDIVECYDDKGRVYYFNKKTGKTTWDKPPEYAAMLRAFEGVAKLTEAHKDNISAVDPAVLKGAVKYVAKHANEPGRLTALARALATLATNDENRTAIANAGGLQAIIQALNGDNVDAEFLVAAIALLNQFARNDFFKEQICQMGGVKALIRLMIKFIDIVDVVEKCLSCLANLAFNSPMNMKQVMACGGVDAVEKVMKKHPRESKVLQLTMVLLSNLMYGNDENKLIIGRKCGDEIVNVIRVFFRDVKLFKGAMRALGNLSYCDENIRWIVENGATKCIVAGMVANKDEIEAQQIAIDVIGNFASLQENDVREKIARGELQSVYDIIVIEGGAAKILDTVKQTSEPQLLMSGMDALSNLANDPSVTEKLIKMGIVGVVLNAMQKYDWDEDLMDRTVRLIAILTYSKGGVEEFGKRDGIQVLLSAMETHAGQIDFLTNAAAALKNIAGNEELREQIFQLGGVDATLALVERNLGSKPFLLEILALYIRMTRAEHVSEEIAQKGMHVILKTIHTHERDAKYLTSAFTLLGHLAFAPKNLKIIVQYGGIGLIISSICEHPDSRELMTRSIQTLDNIAMASPEHAKIVIKEGGDVTIKEVVAAYKDDKTVVQYGKSALLSMTALEKRPARKGNRIQYQGNRNDVQSSVDPLKDYRTMLQAGKLMTEWSGGGPHSRHLYVSPDWRSIVWKDPKKSAKSGNKMELRNIRAVRGFSDGHKKGKKKANKDRALTIVCRASDICFEAASEEDAKLWIAGLRALINTYKRDPRWLK